MYDAWQAQKNSGSRSLFGAQEFRDLQMWSQLAWFDEEFQEHDPEVREWVRRGRNFTLADQRRMGEKQREIVGQVLPEYRKLAAAGQIEISTTPYYHPILPLLCDSNIAAVAHPGVPLPPRFRYPQDARRQLALAREYDRANISARRRRGCGLRKVRFRTKVFAIAAELGFEWAATDSGVLNRTLGVHGGRGRPVPPLSTGGREAALGVIFRDHFLSDLIGFVYSKMDAAAAAEDFLRRIRENCAGILASGRDALVPIILDGENAWEYYDRNGRPFLRELYRRISAGRRHARRDGERGAAADGAGAAGPHLSRARGSTPISTSGSAPRRTTRPGRSFCARARPTTQTTGVPEEQRRLAFEELLIAEGSDWCWWYGPEHDSANRAEFDQLFRSHLANVYRFLNLTPPEELSRPILRSAVPAAGDRRRPGPITPVIDGEVTSYFEWMGAGSLSRG